MALVVEDGTGTNPDANTYADDAALTSYADSRGLTYPADSAAREILLLKAMDYIEVRDYRFKGERTAPTTQPLSWPRDCVYLVDMEDNEFPDNEIPADLIRAQVVLALAAQTVDLAPIIQPNPIGAVMMEQVGPIKTQYAKQQGSDYYATVTYADQLLARLYKGQGRICTVRV